MSPASGVPAATLPPTGQAVTWQPPDRRRTLQLLLATFWLIDAVLQLQPVMFTRMFGTLMLGPNAQGNPGAVGRSITDVSRAIGQHAVGADALFVAVQLLIAVAIANRRTVRVGLAASVLWSLLVWWFGEGLGMLLTGTASPLTGAPGPVLLYAVLAVVLWPADDADAPFVAAAPVGVPAARALWILIWASLGALALFGPLTRSPARLWASTRSGEPGWLVAFDDRLVQALNGHGALLAGVAGGLLVAIALAVLVPPRGARPLLGVAVAVGLLVWVAGENFGAVFTGSATDPNSGPLLALLAVAYWPRVRHAPSERQEARAP